MSLDVRKEIEGALADLETLLKNGDVVGDLTERGINASLALLSVDALRNYLQGNKAQAAEDFATVADEIGGRLAITAIANAKAKDDGELPS